MKCGNLHLSYRVGAIVTMMSLIVLGRPTLAAAQVPGAPVGPGTTLVHSMFGGQIFGFDIDQNGTEGVLSEAQDISGGDVLAAGEKFGPGSGKVVTKTQTKDDFLTLGVVGSSVGLVEREHVMGIFVTKRIYEVLNPLSSNKFTAMWT